MKLRNLIAIFTAALLLLASCGGSNDDDAAQTDTSDEAVQVDDESDNGQDAPEGSDSGGGGGTLVLDGATIELTSARCYLQEQDAAAGGGKILYTGQATGVDADGAAVMIDVSHYDEDSQFAGDQIDVVVGEPTDPEAVSFMTPPGQGDGDVVLDGSTLSSDGVELMDSDAGTPMKISFEINC